MSTSGAVELRNSLIERFGVELSPTVTFDYPTLPALALYIAKLTTAVQQEPLAAAPTLSRAEVDIEDIRYPSFPPSECFLLLHLDQKLLFWLQFWSFYNPCRPPEPTSADLAVD
jgi:hypothetical protein